MSAAESSETKSSKKQTPVCSSRSCQKPSAGVAPVCGLALCQQHLDRDLQKAEKRKTKLLNKLQTLQSSRDRQELRTELQMLAAEIEQVTDMFDAVQEKLHQWRERAVSRVQAVHDSVARRLRDAAEAEECSKEVSLACDAGDMRRVMQLTVSMESWQDEARERAAEFERIRSELCDRQGRQDGDQKDGASLRLVGDVAAEVQQLQFMIDRHMADVKQQCWLDEGEASAAPEPVCRFVGSVDGLMGYPKDLVLCTNTAGFVGDSSGRVFRAESAAADDGCMPLPQPCVFVVLQVDTADHLLATSVDGLVRFQVDMNLVGPNLINGLHCDSQRQQLFVAQSGQIGAIDLSGHFSSPLPQDISGSSIRQSGSNFQGIDGNSEEVFVLEAQNGNILQIEKDSGRLQSIIDVSFIPLTCMHLIANRVSLQETAILVTNTDAGQVHKVCWTTDRLIMSYPSELTGVEQFQSPVQVAVDSRGLVFVSEKNGALVRILSNDGAVLHTIERSDDEPDSDDEDCDWEDDFVPAGITVLDSESRRLVVVADYHDRRLRVFDME